MARFMLMRLTSQQEFAIWQPAWPTTDNKDISIKNEEEWETRDTGGVRRVKGSIPLMLMTSLIFADDYRERCGL